MKDSPIPTGKPFWLRMNRQLYVIMLCFFISTIFWLLLALSNDYTTSIIFPINYKNLPGKKVIMNDLPAQIEVQLKTTGFKLISFDLSKTRDSVTVDVSERLQNTSIQSDLLALPTSFFLKDFSKELGGEVSISGFKPDSIIFNFSDMMTKRVTVKAIYQVSFDKQFDSVGTVMLNPSEVEVSGPPNLVEDLNYVTTEKLRMDNQNTSIKKNIALEKNRLLTYNVSEVEFNLPVEKYTEGIAEITINPINVSSGYSLKTFPDKVKVRYLVAISNYNKVDASMFDAIVDGGESEMKHTAKLDVQVITKPPFVRVTLLEPEKVDYILRRQ
jgi:hypothetical protein